MGLNVRDHGVYDVALKPWKSNKTWAFQNMSFYYILENNLKTSSLLISWHILYLQDVEECNENRDAQQSEISR